MRFEICTSIILQDDDSLLHDSTTAESLFVLDLAVALLVPTNCQRVNCGFFICHWSIKMRVTVFCSIISYQCYLESNNICI
jgi:hypothetical protein